MARPDFIDWVTSPGGLYLYDKKKPTLAMWLPHQRDILRHIFPAGDDPLPYNRICWSTPKKTGKTEFAAATHLYFGTFVDVPGEQYVLANDYEGAKSRVWRYIIGSLERNPLMRDTDWRQVGSEIYLGNGTLIKAIASDYRGEAGSNHSLATVDEPWGIVHENALRLMTEFGPVPTRENSTILYTGYQGFEGQSEFWHNLIDSGMGEPVAELAHIENGDGAPACWRAGKTFVYWDHLGRMPWHTPEFLDDQRRAFKGRMSEFLRVWENRRVHSADAFCTPEQWEKLYDTTLRALHNGDERTIVLAADAATKSDCCALVGSTWNPETKKVEVVYCGIWRPEDGRPIQLTATIGPEIVRLNQSYHVAAVYFDPYQMQAIAEMCRKAGVVMVEFPQTSRRIQSDTHLHQLIWGGNLAHYGDPELREHVTNALTKATERGQRIVKELSSMKVDGAVALAMSALGAVEMLAGYTGKMAVQPNVFFGG